MEKFIASEVRNALHETTCPVSAKLVEIIYAYADRLEADEKAVPVELDYYDAGHLNDFGGGNVSWWWDYIRGELGRAHSFYQSQVNDITSAPADAERLAEALRWIMRTAGDAKEPCGGDPESPAAIRNGVLASISQAAAQSLGIVQGPSLAELAALKARIAAALLADVRRAPSGLGRVEVEGLPYEWIGKRVRLVVEE